MPLIESDLGEKVLCGLGIQSLSPAMEVKGILQRLSLNSDMDPLKQNREKACL